MLFLTGSLRVSQRHPGSPCLSFMQRVLVYLFVVWMWHFHASLPTLEMLLGFLQGEVRCQILSDSEHNRSLPMRLLLSLLKLPLQPWLFFPFCPLLQNNACQLTPFSSQGPTWWHHLFCSLVFNCWWRSSTHGGLVSFSDHR